MCRTGILCSNRFGKWILPWTLAICIRVWKALRKLPWRNVFNLFKIQHFHTCVNTKCFFSFATAINIVEQFSICHFLVVFIVFCISSPRLVCYYSLSSFITKSGVEKWWVKEIIRLQHWFPSGTPGGTCWDFQGYLKNNQ